MSIKMKSTGLIFILALIIGISTGAFIAVSISNAKDNEAACKSVVDARIYGYQMLGQNEVPEKIAQARKGGVSNCELKKTFPDALID